MATHAKNILQVGGLTLTPGKKGQVTLSMEGKETIVPFKELWSAVFVLSSKEYKAQLIPHQKEERMLFSRKLRIRAEKDMRAGEELVVWVEFDVAKAVVEAIAEKNGARVIEPLSNKD